MPNTFTLIFFGKVNVDVVVVPICKVDPIGTWISLSGIINWYDGIISVMAGAISILQPANGTIPFSHVCGSNILPFEIARKVRLLTGP